MSNFIAQWSWILKREKTLSICLVILRSNTRYGRMSKCPDGSIVSNNCYNCVHHVKINAYQKINFQFGKVKSILFEERESALWKNPSISKQKSNCAAAQWNCSMIDWKTILTFHYRRFSLSGVALKSKILEWALNLNRRHVRDIRAPDFPNCSVYICAKYFSDTIYGTCFRARRVENLWQSLPSISRSRKKFPPETKFLQGSARDRIRFLYAHFHSNWNEYSYVTSANCHSSIYRLSWFIIAT